MKKELLLRDDREQPGRLVGRSPCGKMAFFRGEVPPEWKAGQRVEAQVVEDRGKYLLVEPLPGTPSGGSVERTETPRPVAASPRVEAPVLPRWGYTAAPPPGFTPPRGMDEATGCWHAAIATIALIVAVVAFVLWIAL